MNKLEYKVHILKFYLYFNCINKIFNNIRIKV